MKKKLEAELISIAHRILKLKNKSELDQLYLETQKLYEKLAVLKFVEENFADARPTIGKAEAESILDTAFDEEETTSAPEVPEVTVEAEPENEEAQEEVTEPEQPEEEGLQSPAMETPTEKEVDEVIAEAEEAVSAQNEQPEPVSEEETDIPAEENVAQPTASAEEDLFKPSFEWSFDNKTDEPATEPVPEQEEPAASGQIAFEDLLGAGYVDPVFVKPGESNEPAAEPIPQIQSYEAPKTDVIPISRREDKVPVFKMNSESTVSLNDRLSKGITVGLNDRIAFVKNLFNNSNEDYNRVLSQLITFDTFAEAQDFIDNMVKPDYNNWDGKDEYAQRFLEVVEKKFS